MTNISLRNVRKTYPGAAAPAVRELSIEIPKSEFLCLLGPSGCGKTTTLRMIAGLEHPTGGAIQIGERVMASAETGTYVPAEERNLGLVFQNYALWPHMSVAQNVEFALKLRNVAKAEREATVSAVLEKLGIARYRDRLPAQLSGGQQQRVALARMMALKPDVILLDEPLSNLDAKLRLEMRAELKRIHRETGATFVFVTHDQWEAMTLATTIAVMSEGELQQLGSPDDIYERPANRFVAEFVGNLPINIIAVPGSGALAQWAQTRLADLALERPAASVGIRPENLKIHASATGHSTPARVVDIVPTGGSWIVETEVGGDKFFAIAAETPELSPGDEVHLDIAPRHIHIFCAEGRRIAP